MAGINSLKGLRNVNLTSIKEGAKKTAALTLLLSTVACTQSDVDNYAPLVPLVCIPVVLVLGIGSHIAINIWEKVTGKTYGPPKQPPWEPPGGDNYGQH